MSKLRVVKASDVMGFSPAATESAYISRLLVDSEGVGSTRLQINHATLKPGKAPGKGEAHPEPHDEAYYILSGQGLMEFWDKGEHEAYEVGPQTAIFIPAGTGHRITNTGDEDLVFLTLWPIAPQYEGVNGVYDERKRAWGRAFRRVDE
ncbi:cupin domain-containing protein [Candidatus Poribacteria bacterium]|nr:cupin domain-containing protein [Candidatus Poribacteria bacterium]